jgi:hypothetical protein
MLQIILLYCKDLYEPIVRDKVPTGVTEEEWRVLNRKTVGMVHFHINHNIFHHVANDKVAFELWQKLESMYERKTAVNKASVIKQLAKLEYRDGSSVIEHLNVFQGHINQLTAMEINLDDEVQALLLLSSLPDSWNTLVVSLSNSAPDGKLAPDMVNNSMLNEESRRKEKGSHQTSSSDAYVAKKKDKNQGRSHKKPQRGRSKSRERSQSGPSDKIIYFHCGKEGHKRNQCRVY